MSTDCLPAFQIGSSYLSDGISHFARYCQQLKGAKQTMKSIEVIESEGNKMKDRLRILMIVALAVGVLAPTAHAGLVTVQLFDGTTTLTIADGDALDVNGATGAVTYLGSIGNWTLNVTTGLSDPQFGLGVVMMDLNTLNLSGGGAGTLTIMLSDTGLLPLSPGWAQGTTLFSSIGGTTPGTVTFDTYLDKTDTLFGTAGGPVTSGTFGSFNGVVTGFSGDSIGSPGPITGAFSLTEVVTITHTAGNQNTSFDASVSVVPVPAAVLLGFLGLGAAGLKLRRFA